MQVLRRNRLSTRAHRYLLPGPHSGPRLRRKLCQAFTIDHDHPRRPPLLYSETVFTETTKNQSTYSRCCTVRRAVKTLAFLNGAGVVSVIFASVQKVQLDTFGAACGALACLLLTLSMRIATDEKMTETFGGIMTGTLRQKTRAHA